MCKDGAFQVTARTCPVQVQDNKCPPARIQCKGPRIIVDRDNTVIKPGGRLLMPTIFDATCTDTLERFHGDPGSQFIVKCPSGCKDAEASVYGIGIFSPDSSICKAALQTGVFYDSFGGEIVVTIG